MRLPHYPLVAPRALLFDVDGVLLDSMRFHALAWQAAVRRVLGGRVTQQAIYRREGEPGRVTARALLRGHGRRFTATDAAALLGEKERRFQAQRHQIHLYPEARPLVRLVGTSGLPAALVTGTSRAEMLRVLPAWVRRCFAVLVTGNDVRHGKPHPEPYRLACRRLRQDPRRVAVIENAPFGIASAKAARVGWIIAVCTSLPRAQLRGADVVVPSLDVLQQYLRQLLAGAPSPSTKLTSCRACA